jgi:hypothetical protein
MHTSVRLEKIGDYFEVKSCDMGEGNTITKSEIEIENIQSLGFWGTRQRVTLRRLILRNFRV